MDEETAIVNNNTRNEKIRFFFKNNKRLLISIFSSIVILIIAYFIFDEYKEKKKIKISNQYNSIVTGYSKNNAETTAQALIKLISKKDSTYSPLSLYFIIDNKLIKEPSKVNELFDIVIEDIYLDREIKNLIIYKKAMYNADIISENELLDILNPILKSESVWKSHALLLMADFFEHSNNLIKSKDFLEEIVNSELANNEIRIEAERRLKRKFGE